MPVQREDVYISFSYHISEGGLGQEMSQMTSMLRKHVYKKQSDYEINL